MPYLTTAPDRQELDALAGDTLLEFGTGWCGHCRAAQAPITEALHGFAALRHLKIEDGPGRALGRSFAVRLWPTLVVLRDGQEVARVVRPRDAAAVRLALDTLRGAPGL